MLESRIIELETRLAFTEDLLETLNETVIRQQAHIDRMQQQIHLLHEQMQSSSSNEPRNLRDEILPHY